MRANLTYPQGYIKSWATDTLSTAFRRKTITYLQFVTLPRMARVELTGEKYILRLSPWERFFALHKNPEAPKSALDSVTQVVDPWTRKTIRGFRAPGAAIPYVLLLGTMRFRGGKDFTAIYRRKPADVYTFTSGEFKRWIVSAK